MVEFAQHFVKGIGDDIKDMVTDTRTVENGYPGLDSDRDTEAEVTTMLGFYPEILTQTEDRWNMVPIQCLPMMIDHDCRFVCNTKAVSFVHLFIELAMQFNSFEAQKRGGLLTEDEDGDNTLTFLVTSSHQIYQEQEDPQFIDCRKEYILLVLVLEPLHRITYACSKTSAVEFAARLTHKDDGHESSAQGFVSLLLGLGTVHLLLLYKTLYNLSLDILPSVNFHY